jgi:hypothetical protein
MWVKCVSVESAETHGGKTMMMTSSSTQSYDMQHVECLVYHYADKPNVEVEMPATLAVAETGEHLIEDVAGVGVIMPAGWLRITVYPRFERKPFEQGIGGI